MERKYKKGDIVVLKSGGPNMTVNDYAWEGNYQSNDSVICFWFDSKNKKRESIFDQETITKAE